MREFKKWLKNNWSTLKEISPYPFRNLLQKGWKASLECYQNIAMECEKNCFTDNDYKVLYFHLK